jgi:DNA-binding XRE family transcriptional regulator
MDLRASLGVNTMPVMAKKRAKPKKTRKREPATAEFTAKQIRAIREARGLTRKQAADLIGVSARTWMYYETDSQAPSRPVCILIAQLKAGTLL